MNSCNVPGPALLVTPHLPTGLGGGAFATLAFLQSLADIFGSDLDVLGPTGIAQADLPRSVGQVIEVPERGILAKFVDLAGGRSIDRVGSYFRRHASSLAQEYKVLVFDKGTVLTAPAAATHAGQCAVVIHHNIEADYFGTQARTIRDRFVSAAAERLERQAYRGATVNLTLTEQDRSGLDRRCGTGAQQCEVLGGFERRQVRLPEIQPVRSSSWPTLVATGSLNSNQTIDGILSFTEECWPAIRSAFPESRLIVAGRRPAAELRESLEDAGIEIIADPPEMVEILEQGHVYVAPVRLGSGMKYRVMDALRHGLPALCHPVSASGYELLSPMGAVRLCTSGEDYVAALRELVDFQSLDFRRSVQDAYWHRFSYDSGRARLEALLQRFAGPDAGDTK